MLINTNNRNISVSANNGYTLEKVLKAKNFIKNLNLRKLDAEKLITFYNELFNANEKIVGCKSCALRKYLVKIESYAVIGKDVLINTGKATEDDFKATTEPLKTSDDKVINEEKKVPQEAIIEEIRKHRGRKPKNNLV